VRELVEDVVAQLGASAGGASLSGAKVRCGLRAFVRLAAAPSPCPMLPASRRQSSSKPNPLGRTACRQVHDAAAALEAIHDGHLGQLLPRVRQCDGQVGDFLGRCVAAKAAMGRDVLEQLQVRRAAAGGGRRVVWSWPPPPSSRCAALRRSSLAAGALGTQPTPPPRIPLPSPAPPPPPLSQRIAAQQSRIRDMKDKLAAFGEVLARQAAAFAELRAATR
jgi:hypothetical protein